MLLFLKCQRRTILSIKVQLQCLLIHLSPKSGQSHLYPTYRIKPFILSLIIYFIYQFWIKLTPNWSTVQYASVCVLNGLCLWRFLVMLILILIVVVIILYDNNCKCPHTGCYFGTIGILMCTRGFIFCAGSIGLYEEVWGISSFFLCADWMWLTPISTVGYLILCHHAGKWALVLGWRLIRACQRVLLSVQGSITAMLLCIITGIYSHLKACIPTHYKCDNCCWMKKEHLEPPPKHKSWFHLIWFQPVSLLTVILRSMFIGATFCTKWYIVT